MKTKENQKLKEKNNKKLKRRISVITVFLWVFLVATMITVVIGNTKNTNALEHDNVEIYEENNEIPSTYESSVSPPTINNILDSSMSKLIAYISCYDSNEHKLLRYEILDDSAINVGEITPNTGGTNKPLPSTYPYTCEINLNLEFLLKEYNNYASEQGFGKHSYKFGNKTLKLYYDIKNKSWYNFESSSFYIKVSHLKPNKPSINNIVKGSELVKFVCKDSSNHEATDDTFESNSAISLGEVVFNDGAEGVSIVSYPWMCDLKLNSNYWIDLYNNYASNQGFGKHWIINNNDSLRLYYSSGKWTYKKVAVPLEIEITHISPKYDVVYNDGVSNEVIFPDQIYEGLHEDDETPVFDGTPFRKGYIFIGWAPTVNPIVSPSDSDENNVITYTATWKKILSPDRIDLYSILKEFVKVHCVKNIHEDKFYSTWSVNLDGIYEASIGEIYYSEEKNKHLCDVTLNGEVYSSMYELVPSSGVGIIHHLVRDNNINEPAILDEDKKKVITLYYDEKEDKWKKLDDIELPIVFNVTCDLSKVDGLYKVNHEYYVKNENDDMVLEGTLSSNTISVVYEYGKRIKVGVADEFNKVNIEVEKIPNYEINNVNYIYEYLENSGNIILEVDTIKEITLKYVRDISNEIKIKVEKLWEDENNKYSKRPENVVLQIKNGEEVISEMYVSEKNNWSCEFVVPKYDKDGNEIKYTVDEKETSEFYEKVIDGYKVINRYIEENNEDSNINNEIKKDEENIDTSDINILMYVVIFTLSILAIGIYLAILKKKYNR